MSIPAISLEDMGRTARHAARGLIRLTTAQKNQALLQIAQGLRDDASGILQANLEDVQAATQAGLTPALIDRLSLSPSRLEAVAKDVESVAALPDPVGHRFDERILPNGLRVHRRRSPLGVVGVIYESRPNVTVDVATLCLKAGSAVILRGGKETLKTNAALVSSLEKSLHQAGLPEGTVQVIAQADRAVLLEFLRLDKYVDMIIPRGGEGLHRFCRENATIPVITGGIGVCHLYADPTVDISKAIPLIYNAKVQRPSVCNALDTLLVHASVTERLLPELARSLAGAGVELRGDARSLPLLQAGAGIKAVAAGEGDFGKEFLDLILSVRVVDSLDEALDHIATYASGHSDGILTQDPEAAQRFQLEVDSAAVFVNASTRFNDGGQLGLGAEVAISTQKLHARGPMALEELTTYKWIVEGDGHVRP